MGRQVLEGRVRPDETLSVSVQQGRIQVRGEVGGGAGDDVDGRDADFVDLLAVGAEDVGDGDLDRALPVADGRLALVLVRSGPAI